MRIDRICAFAGSGLPSKPSTRMTAPGPAMSCSCCCSVTGSSDSASICSRVSDVPNDMPRVGRGLLLVLPTVTDASSFGVCRTATCLLSPA
jgi:hypothetical protein